MKNLVKNLIKFSGITFTIITPLLAFPQESFAQSSFASSCNNSSIAGDTLSARCRARNGSFKNTSIRLRGITNRNGNLVFVGRNRASSFQSSCNNIAIAGDTLSANCRRRNGSFNRTSIRVPGLKNINGNLTY
jgi:CVNH domain